MDWRLTGDRPIWQQLTEQVTARILAGEYPPGSRLPAVRELAAQAGVNPNTMQRAMVQLEQDGLAVGSRTAGRTVTVDESVIAAAREQRAQEAARQYLDALAALGYSPEDAGRLIKEEAERHG